MMMGVMRIILIFGASLALVTGQVSYEILQSNILSCCHYCRSEPKHWVSVKGGVQIKPKIEATSLDNPPAYLVSDEEEVEFNNEGRGYKLNYAGALLKMKYEDLNNVDGLLNEQYMQIDMAEPKFVGGILTQGGFYEEKLLGLIPYQESWVTRFVLSYSNSSSKDFQLYKTETGVTQTFTGNYDVTHSKLSSLVPAIVARYVRYHPLLAQNEAGAVDQASMRVTAVTCQADLCATTRINCLLTQWSAWSECTCEAGCSQARTRSVRRVQACGGSRCGSLREQQTCTPPEPAWKSTVQYGGIALGVILLIAVIAFVIYKKTHKDRVEVIVVKENNDDDDRHKRPGMMGGHHPRPNGPPMGFRPPGAPQPGAMRGPSMPPNFTGFGARPPFAPGAPGMRPRFPPPGMGAPGQAPPGGMPSINN